MKRELHLGDPCVFCDTPWDQIQPGPCPGRPGLDEGADWLLTFDALQERYLKLHEHNMQLEEELEKRNYACGDALDKLWKEIVYARHGEEYGDWEYAGQAYRHLKAEYEDQQQEIDRLRAFNAELVAAVEAFVCRYHEHVRIEYVRQWEREAIHRIEMELAKAKRESQCPGES